MKKTLSDIKEACDELFPASVSGVGGARIRYGTEVTWFVTCLPSSTGEIHHYDTEVKKNNFGQVLASGDKIL
jgi:hypothetical protein